MKNEDTAFEQRRQKKLDESIPLYKVGSNLRYTPYATKDPHPEIPFGKDAPVIETWEKWMWTIAAAAVVTVLLTSNAFANPEEHRLNQERMLQLQEQQVLNQERMIQMQQRQMQNSTPVYVMQPPDYGAVISRAVKQYQDQQRRQQ